MRKINIEDLKALAVGAGILGSGGGGDPKYDLLMTRYLVQKHGPVSIISLDELNDEDLIVPVAFIGAGLITKEKLPSGREFVAIINRIKKYFGNKKIVLMAGEIGGANAFSAISAGAILNFPILDADTIGRAFPELQMSSCNLNGILPSPAFLSDSKENIVIIEAKDCKMIERLARSITIKMGSSACVSLYIMKGKQAKAAVMRNTLSKSIEIGRSIIRAQKNKENVIDALIKATNGKCIFQGTITDLNQEIKDGFLQGSLTIFNYKKKCKIEYQNENLIAEIDGEIIASTPDIITVVDTLSGNPITCESLSYGQRVSIIIIPSPYIWTTKKGLEIVGPKAFGFDIKYKPMNQGAVK
jgi:DUF917 family protein